MIPGYLTTLAGTVDAVNDAHFYARPAGITQRRAVARWIAARQGLPGSYAAMFALTESERRDGVRLFTGERTRNAAARHIMGEEACRALILLNLRDTLVQAALTAATAGMLQRLHAHESRAGGAWLRPRVGTYCCGQCSVSLWRHLAVGGLDQQERRLAGGLRALKAHRKSAGRWRVFPFWYTVLALLEIDLPAARTELKYAGPRLEKPASRHPSPDPWFQRRREIARRALTMI